MRTALQNYFKWYESVYHIKIISLTAYEIMFIENFTVITVRPLGTKHICRKLNKRIIKVTNKQTKKTKQEKKMQSVKINHLINPFRNNAYSFLIWSL